MMTSRSGAQIELLEPVAPGATVRQPDLTPMDLLLCFLEYGEWRAQTIPALAERSGMSVRQVQRAVELARAEGRGICANESGPHRGVYLTLSGDELRQQYRRKRRRALHQLANLRRMLRTADLMDGVRPAPVVVLERPTLWGEKENS